VKFDPAATWPWPNQVKPRDELTLQLLTYGSQMHMRPSSLQSHFVQSFHFAQLLQPDDRGSREYDSSGEAEKGKRKNRGFTSITNGELIWRG
jgi:hypothetical protein